MKSEPLGGLTHQIVMRAAAYKLDKGQNQSAKGRTSGRRVLSVHLSSHCRAMALLCFNSLTLCSSSSSPALAFTPSAASRRHLNPTDLAPRTSSGIRISTAFPVKKVSAFAVRADAGADAEASAAADDGSTPERKEEVVPVDKLPLESKLQERQEQKLKMKLAKKIRLRRKRLVRKRRLRKKGRWPPSKMKKLKNV